MDEQMRHLPADSPDVYEGQRPSARTSGLASTRLRAPTVSVEARPEPPRIDAPGSLSSWNGALYRCGKRGEGGIFQDEDLALSSPRSLEGFPVAGPLTSACSAVVIVEGV
ncbi:hypothetical protein [Ktedonobacter racemifer]|uniref:hypothetical protein n=1 Tax=Ktedonobacter racemifer TaxID=363277 RepID=UPI0012F8F56B|nr:hypothetical protein [Ktedonobacter racemifer]